MSSEMMDAITALAQEKQIDELHLITCLEDSLAETYADLFNLKYGAHVTIDRQLGKIYVYENVPVGEPDEETGEYSEFEKKDITPDDTSRIAAQNAKRVIDELVKEASREQIYKEFSDRVGDVIAGTILQSTSDFTIIKIRDGVEAELPHFDQRVPDNDEPRGSNERPQGERYAHNDRIKALIIEVRDPHPDEKEGSKPRDKSRPTIVVSRTHPDLIKRLFELEVPEVYEGIVEIKSVVREPGVRSKVAVSSLDPRLDPVGACVGPRGSRVRLVVNELQGERVDIIQWDEDPAVYIGNALSPSRITSVVVDAENQHATVIVPDDQLSLAIGKEGQNARLAARLTGWHIDIKNVSLAADMLTGGTLFIDEEENAEPDELCDYVGENGLRCRNHKREGSLFCGVHDGTDVASNEKRIQDAKKKSIIGDHADEQSDALNHEEELPFSEIDSSDEMTAPDSQDSSDDSEMESLV